MGCFYYLRAYTSHLITYFFIINEKQNNRLNSHHLLMFLINKRHNSYHQ